MDNTLLTATKLALRITTDAFNDELTRLIKAGQQDLGIAGVVVPETLDDIVLTAVITYVKMNFGNPENYDRLQRCYDEQKAQLSMATGYTSWGVD